MKDFRIIETVNFIREKRVFSLMQYMLDSIYINLYDDMMLLLVAEKYKIVSNDDLLDSLDPEGKLMTYVGREVIHPKFHNIIDEVHRLGFFFANYDENKNEVIIVTSIDNVNNHQIELYFSDTKVKIYGVTPLNYELLKGEKTYQEMLNPSLIFFRVIADALEQKCTDVHFMSYKVDVNTNVYPVKYRIGNDLVTRNLFEINEYLNSEMIKQVIRERTDYQVTDIDILAGVGASIHNPFYSLGNDLRVNVTKTICGYKITVRILSVGNLVARIENLGFHQKINQVLDRVTRTSNGLTLVTGPQRSGKNTTLLAVINQMIGRPINILDFSSPVETVMPSVMQVDYKGDPAYLASLVKSCKKHDADIALINELPNNEIADSVYDLVNSSVGVMTTFHLNRIWHLCYKLKEYFGENIYNLFTNLNYVFNQKIFIKQCPHCQETYMLDKYSDLYPEVLEIAKKHNISYYKESKGCNECNFTGVQKGIQPYVEYLIFDEDFRTKLFNCSTLYEMELLIKKKVHEDNSSLEYFVISDVMQGVLHPNQLITLL